jgi:DNA-binding transcriptional regulator YdaS (Cro superfamily)
MTRSDLGALIGVQRNEIYRWERGERRIPPERVPHISRITGIAPELLRPDVFGPFENDALAPELRNGTRF